MKRFFEVWSEGWAATGQSDSAQLHGTVEAQSFREACDKLLSRSPTYDPTSLRLWGCRLFDNERDARRAFG